MIFEHEIPSGSRLYFGESARAKREVERIASDLLLADGFAEIVTPLFSYHQHQSIRDPRQLVRLADAENRELTLRADSTLDVVRLVTKRLGRSTDQKKWFYIQPVYRYPTEETHQIGAEWLGGDLADVLTVTTTLFEALGVDPVLQISNIRIPVLISERYGIPLAWFAKMELEKLLSTEHDWLGRLARIQYADQLDTVLSQMPEVLQPELKKMRSLIEACGCGRCVLAPLYYAQMRYYDDLFFQAFAGNSLLASGGHFVNEEISAAGFALYTDALIDARRHETERV